MVASGPGGHGSPGGQGGLSGPGGHGDPGGPGGPGGPGCQFGPGGPGGQGAWVVLVIKFVNAYCFHGLNNQMIEKT